MPVYDVFISYSSVDRELAEQVHADLVRAELKVWRDRDRLVPGLRFTPAIFDALRQSRLCLCLVSEAYLRSGYANQEAGAARGFGVRLFPVRIGAVQRDLLVGVIQEVHVPALGDDLPDVRALVQSVAREVVGALRGASGSMVPSLPRFYVERAELRETVARLAEHPPPWLAIAGLPGAGRTTFAAALVGALAPAFDQRVFWVERQMPNPEHGLLAHLQHQLLRQLTDEPPSPTTWQEGRRQLRRLAAAYPGSGRCLLVVDDAEAEPDLLAAFDINPQWTVVVVAQDAARFAGHLPADCVIRLGPLSPEDAREMAARILGVPSTSMGALAGELLDKVNRHPQAIRLAASLVQTSVDSEAQWSDLLDAINEGALRELDHPSWIGGGMVGLVQSALGPLDRAQLKALTSLAALPDGSCFDVPLLQSVWSAAKERHVRTLASRLRELFLLNEAPCGLRMPSLVRVFLRGRKNFVAEYRRVLANVFPNVDPLILSIAWDDRDVFERLLRPVAKPATKVRSSSKGQRNDRWRDAWHGGLHAVHFAVQQGRMEMLVRLLGAGAPIDARTEPVQQTPLHLAIHHRQPKLAALLLERGATVNVADAGGYTPLHVAAQLDDAAAITLLLARGADPYGRNTKKNQPLHVAAALGSADAAAVLVGLEPALASETGQDGGRPLLFAALNGHAKVVDVLLGAGVRPDEPHPSGETPLHLAARGGHEVVVARLLAGGARVDPTVDGVTPLFLAAQEGRTGVVQRLLAAGANPSGGRLEPSGMSALHTSAGSGFLDVVNLLVHAGASVGVTDTDGRTPLHYAAQASSVGGGTTGFFSMREGGTETSMATSIWRRHCADTVSFLLGAGVPVDAASSSGHTALHVAAGVGASAAVQALLSSGANRRLRDTRGLTAADVARRAGFEAIAEAIDAHVKPDASSAPA